MGVIMILKKQTPAIAVLKTNFEFIFLKSYHYSKIWMIISSLCFPTVYST